MFDRREFLRGLAGAALAGATLACVPAAGAERQPRVRRIGVLGNDDSPAWEAFRAGLRALGYVDGQNVRIDWRWTRGSADELRAAAGELAWLAVDVLVASGTPLIRALKQETTTIPIVMANSAYPDKVGLVASLARPGGNVTGLDNIGPGLKGKQVQLLREIAPGLSRIAMLWDPANPVERFASGELTAAASAAGLATVSVPVSRQEEYRAAFAAASAGRADALFATGNPVNFRHRQLIAELALQARLPSVFDERLFVDAGGLLSYAPSYVDMFRRAAGYVDRILKGAKPADLPVEQPTKFELVVSLKTAEALGLAAPKALLQRADDVVR